MAVVFFPGSMEKVFGERQLIVETFLKLQFSHSDGSAKSTSSVAEPKAISEAYLAAYIYNLHDENPFCWHAG